MMRIISASVANFASYNNLSIDFADQGLTLIQGPTGSGKSTLCDIVPWVLFGKTAKDGAVDEIRSWGANEATEGEVTVDLGNICLWVMRIRGPGKNDLYFQVDESEVTRGKDINDTQKLINSILGLDSDLYLAGAYFHEFSQTAQFFTTTPKNRRAICEQIVDLSLAKKLQKSIPEELKLLNRKIQPLANEIHGLEATIRTLSTVKETEEAKAKLWNNQRIKDKELYAKAYNDFEKNRIKTISNKCKACNTVLAAPKTITDDSINPYRQKLKDLETEVNPFDKGAEDYSAEILGYKRDLVDKQAALAAHIDVSNDLELLQDVVAAYRSSTIENTIGFVEAETNRLLRDHFDSECQVDFTIESADKLDIIIYKDGNEASYTQLSKGQRQLLKLCFGVAVMRQTANYSGVNFKQIWIDEALSGLDDKLKAKAYKLFEKLALEYDSIFVVDHSTELKEMFINKITVDLINGQSHISK